MTWELDSNNPEQWAAIRRGLEQMPKESLIEALVANHLEDCEKKQGVCLSLEGLQTLEKFAKYEYERPEWMGHDQLVEACFERVEQHMTCTNGGFAAYIDEGGFHLVTLADEEERDCA